MTACKRRSSLQLGLTPIVLCSRGPRLPPPGQKPCVGSRSPCGNRYVASSIYSDDGKTWRFSAPVPNPLERQPNELQGAQLANGTVVLNVRDEKSQMRLLASSHDDGTTFSPLATTPYLVGSVCQGSTVSAGGVLFFSHPFDKASRANGWIKFSANGGRSWWLWRQVDPSTFAYSAMTVVDVNETHVSLGVVYEGATGLRWTVVTGFLPQAGAGAGA